MSSNITEVITHDMRVFRHKVKKAGSDVPNLVPGEMNNFTVHACVCVCMCMQDRASKRSTLIEFLFLQIVTAGYRTDSTVS